MSVKLAGLVLAGSVLVMAGAAALPAVAQDSGPISPQRMSDIVREIASDAYQGRAPGGPARR